MWVKVLRSLLAPSFAFASSLSNTQAPTVWPSFSSIILSSTWNRGPVGPWILLIESIAGNCILAMANPSPREVRGRRIPDRPPLIAGCASFGVYRDRQSAPTIYHPPSNGRERAAWQARIQIIADDLRGHARYSALASFLQPMSPADLRETDCSGGLPADCWSRTAILRTPIQRIRDRTTWKSMAFPKSKSWLRVTTTHGLVVGRLSVYAEKQSRTHRVSTEPPVTVSTCPTDKLRFQKTPPFSRIPSFPAIAILFTTRLPV